MAKNDNALTLSPSRINLKLIFLQNYQFFMNYAKGPVKVHLLEAEKKTFDPWSIKRVASFRYFFLLQKTSCSNFKDTGVETCI